MTRPSIQVGAAWLSLPSYAPFRITAFSITGLLNKTRQVMFMGFRNNLDPRHNVCTMNLL